MLANSSMKKLATCTPELINVVLAVEKRFPLKVICGHRGQVEQDAAFNSSPKRSQTPWPESKHNKLPSLAIDIVPLEHIGEKEFIDWNDRERMTLLAGFILTEAFHQGFKFRWGGDWNRDTGLKDNEFDDLPHFELVEV